jgi:glycosyltransferase involved in cell wall biosynthesis
MGNSSRLSILEVSEPNKDGVFIHVRGLLRHLVKAGHELVYAYSEKRSASQLGDFLKELDAAGVTTKRLQIGNAPCAGDVAAGFWLLWSICTQRPDVVHGHSSKAGALIRLAAALLPGPAYIYTPHAYYSMSERPRGMKIGYWWLEKLLSPLSLTINISRDERRFAVSKLGLGRAKACVSPNPVDLERFNVSNKAARQELRRQWGIPEGRVVFGTLARFGSQKDLDTFYRAAIDCAVKLPNIHFMHLGAGDESVHYLEKTKQAGVGGQFTHIDYLADPAPFYGCLNAFVITSRFEAGWPIVMLEALALGLPVITTDFVGIYARNPAELSHATLVPVGDAGALAKQIQSVASWGGDMQTNHREYVERFFSPAICYGAVANIYRDLSASPVIV